MKEFRILFTGVGRRIELIQAFRSAALNLDIKLKIYGTDITPTAPALFFCDHARKVCRVKDPNYIPQLLDICKQDRIDLVIPTIDTDLLLLSQSTERFAAVNTKVMISTPDKIAVCRDKNLTFDFFKECGVKAPETFNDYKKYQGPFPCFIKPKDGSSSINAFKVTDKSQLSMYAEKMDDYIIQPFIQGTEYTVDIFCDFDGNPVFITPRIRLAVRSGEVSKTKIVNDRKILDETYKIIEKFKPCGPMTVQLIRQDETLDDYFIEINPRYGGGAPLSMKSGARSAESVLQILSGTTPVKSTHISDGAVYSRFDQSVCICKSEIPHDIKGVIFDLDDTLYSEKEYVRSGFCAVARFLGNDEYADRLISYFQQGKQAIDELLTEEGLTGKKAECISIYREHMPEISLYNGVKELISKLHSAKIKVGIITDGRVSGQKNKLASLGLDKIIDDIIITDELGGPQFRKPNDISFRIMQCRWKIPFEEMIYIADNPTKDFHAPKQLGMNYLWFKNPDGLYSTDDCDMQDNEVVERIEDIETKLFTGQNI